MRHVTLFHICQLGFGRSAGLKSSLLPPTSRSEAEPAVQVVTKFMLFCGTNCRDPRKSKYLLTARLSTR